MAISSKKIQDVQNYKFSLATTLYFQPKGQSQNKKKKIKKNIKKENEENEMQKQGPIQNK